MKLFFNILFFIFSMLISNLSFSCDNLYEIKAGDTLSAIATEYYGERNKWDIIYYRNKQVIGNNPGLVKVGQEICIPKLNVDDSQFNEQATPSTKQEEEDEEFSLTRPIDLLTANGYAPFTDEELPYKGMTTHIITEVFTNLSPPVKYEIDFIDDWGSHLDPLLKKVKYDGGFPWLKPDCNKQELLSENMKIRCKFEFSEPLFEIVIALFKKIGKDYNLSSYSDLHGKKICRPSGYYTFDLEQNGLIAGDNYELVTPGSVNECFELLMDEQVDFVSINKFTGEGALKELDLKSSDVSALETLTSLQGLHLVIYKGNPKAFSLMKKFNQGLETLKNSGALEQIQTFHLQKFYD